ncbi:MAG: hypothetical protein CVV64_05580 [Candidatus Wallbacteria bacterium HGW-Wallbacteria-1]|jgi:predicted Zn finger-like uncharacterized protein|uniref:Uncharacterized protein n=1 Tax=Candidatus Wallbacteria bacterium HGW-Wallbacteria-1 TaxID=2013854 RepID=A0A2N1PSC6_9BACT|nr:MAG: hypothetical protein CVV64_05580 [Candidatus Wallbacteria bacterium HGW-Wallbacteria-1]
MKCIPFFGGKCSGHGGKMEFKCFNCGKQVAVDSSSKGLNNAGLEYVEVKCGNCKKRYRFFQKRM